MKAKIDYKNTIKLIIADVDGTLTDGGIYISDSGEQTRRFHTKDGYAIRMLQKKGYHVGIITASFTEGAISTRAKMLGVKLLYIGQEKKTEVLAKWCKKLKITPAQVAYVGDDVIDADIMKAVGLSACPADAVPKIKKIATIVLKNKGGEACFREFADNVFDAC